MGIEWTFETKNSLTVLKFFLFFLGCIDFFVWIFALTLYGIYLFEVSSLFYVMFALHLLHSVTWASSILLAGTGHGLAFDRFATGLTVFTLLTDISALITRIYSGPSGAGTVFDITSYVFTITLLSITFFSSIAIFFSQELGGRHRMMVTDFVNVQLGSQVKGDSLRSTHRWMKLKKRAVRFLASFAAVLFVVSTASFFIQVIFLGEGFLLLLIANIPYATLWLFAFSATGSRSSFPPDGASDVSEIIGTAVAHGFTGIAGFVFIIISALLPMEVPGPPFIELWSSRNWTVAFYVTVTSTIVSILITIFLGWLVLDTMVTYKDTLKTRMRILTDLRVMWKNRRY